MQEAQRQTDPTMLREDVKRVEFEEIRMLYKVEFPQEQSDETPVMRTWIIFGQWRADFPRRIFKKRIKKNFVSLRIETMRES